MRGLRAAGVIACVVVLVLLIFVGGIIALGWMAGSGLDGLCGESLIDQQQSPDGRYEVGVFRRDCGAVSAGNTRHVNLRVGARPFPATVSGTLDDGLVYIDSRAGTWPIIQWKDSTHLLIRAALSSPDSNLTRWRDVNIIYDPVPIDIRHRRTRALIESVPNLWTADLHGRKLIGADLSQEDLTQANLRAANLRYAYLWETLLRNADLRGADLTGAEMNEARVEGADLIGAHLAGADLLNARYNDRTRWPDGFDPRQHGAVPADH